MLTEKVNRILQLLEGEKDVPGILSRLAEHEETLYGKKGANGVVSKVNIMWRVHVWLLCTLSGAAGYWAHELLARFLAHKP